MLDLKQVGNEVHVQKGIVGLDSPPGERSVSGVGEGADPSATIHA